MLIAALTDTHLALLIGGATALGSVVGGLVSMGAEWMRQRSTDRRDEDQRHAETVVAARLVKHDLDAAQLVLDGALASSEWIDAEYLQLRSWDNHCEVLAARLSFEDWETVQRLTTYLRTLADKSYESPLHDGQRDAVEGAAKMCRKAVGLLTPFAGGSPGESGGKPPSAV